MGDVGHLRGGRLGELEEGDVVTHELPRPIDGELAGVRPRVLDEFRGAREGALLGHDEHCGIGAPVRDGLKVPDVVLHLVGKRDGLRDEVRDVVGGELVAVRLGPGHEVVPASLAARPRLVDDVDGLPEIVLLRRHHGHDPRLEVGRAAGAVRHHHADRTIGVLLGGGEGRRRHQGRGKRRAEEAFMGWLLQVDEWAQRKNSLGTCTLSTTENMRYRTATTVPVTMAIRPARRCAL